MRGIIQGEIDVFTRLYTRKYYVPTKVDIVWLRITFSRQASIFVYRKKKFCSASFITHPFLKYLELKESIREMRLAIKPVVYITYHKSTYDYTEMTSGTNGLDLSNLNLWPKNKNYYSRKLKFTNFDMILFTLECGFTSRP
jgi:hypothetical protein